MSNSYSRSYYPAFSTREHELRAYATLDGPIKDQMLPVVTLTRDDAGESFEGSLDALLQAAGGRPLIVDFDPTFKTSPSDEEIEQRRLRREAKLLRERKTPRPPSPKQQEAWDRQRAEARRAVEAFNRSVARLQEPAGGYAAWRSLGLSAPNLIPAAKLGDPAAALAQVEAVTGAGRRIAFRLNLRVPGAVASFLYAARGLSSTDRAILILDAGYIRDDARAGMARVVDALDVIRRGLGGSAFAAMTTVCMAGSFPSSLRDLPTTLTILERDIHAAVVRHGWDVRYGDHASIQHRSPMSGGRGWFPHVDVAHPRQWHFALSDAKWDSNGYIEAAGALVANPPVWSGRAACWGAAMVERASGGVLHDGAGGRLTTPGPWLGVRVSQHLSQQAVHP